MKRWLVVLATLLTSAGVASCASGGKGPAAASTGTVASTGTAASQSAVQSPTVTPSLVTTSETLPNGAIKRQITLPWDRPADQDLQVAAAGLSLTSAETLQVHYHVHLDVYVQGEQVPVPAGLGINAGANGGLPPHGSPGIAPLHTHDTTGILHIEAPARAVFTLGQAFTEWGITLGPGRIGAYHDSDARMDTVAVYVNGKQYTRDPAGIVLTAHDEIAVIVGAPAAPQVTPPSTYAFPAGD